MLKKEDTPKMLKNTFAKKIDIQYIMSTNKDDFQNPFLTRYEKTAIITYRSKQIVNGSKIFLEKKVLDKIGSDPITIATEEFDRGKLSDKIGVRRDGYDLKNW